MDTADGRRHRQGTAQPLLPDCSHAAPCSRPGMGRVHPHDGAVGLGHQGHPGVGEGTSVAKSQKQTLRELCASFDYWGQK